MSHVQSKNVRLVYFDSMVEDPNFELGQCGPSDNVSVAEVLLVIFVYSGKSFFDLLLHAKQVVLTTLEVVYTPLGSQ